MSGRQAGTRQQRAVVTGATSGLGRAIAQQLGRDGLDVIVHGRDAARGTQVVAAIEQAALGELRGGRPQRARGHRAVRGRSR